MNRRWICQSCREVNHLQAPTCFHCAASRATTPPAPRGGDIRLFRVSGAVDASLSLPVIFVAAWSAVIALAVSRVAF